MDLAAFYRTLLTEQPSIGAIAAVKAGMDRYGMGFGSPSIADHREALSDALANPEG